MSEELKASILRVIDEVYNKGNLDVLDELYATGIVRHRPPFPDIEGLDAYKQFVANLRGAYSDLQLTADEIVAEGDTAAMRYTFRGRHTGQSPTLAIPPTGREATMTGCVVAHFVAGKAVEEWEYADFLGALQQLGVTTVPGQGEE